MIIFDTSCSCPMIHAENVVGKSTLLQPCELYAASSQSVEVVDPCFLLKSIKDPQGFDEVSSPFYDDTLLMVLHLMYVPLISIDGYCNSLRCFFDNQCFPYGCRTPEQLISCFLELA